LLKLRHYECKKSFKAYGPGVNAAKLFYDQHRYIADAKSFITSVAARQKLMKVSVRILINWKFGATEER
jgi:hypothetical protein